MRAGALFAGAWLCLGAARCVTEVELVRAPGDVPTSAARWTPVVSGTTRHLRMVWGSGSDDVWAVGDGGTAIRWDGRAWRTVPTGTGATLTGVWAARPDDAWAVGAEPSGAGVLRHWNGARWEFAELPGRDRPSLRAVWGRRSDDVWTVGVADAPDAGVWRWNGTLWRPESVPGLRPQLLTAVGGNDAGVLWIGGPGAALFGRAMEMWAPPRLAPRGGAFGGALCVTGDGTLWATGSSGAVYRDQGTGWTTHPLPPATQLRGLACGRGDEVWAAGEGGRIARWEGGAWAVESVTRANLTAVWIGGRGERWAVGEQGTVLRAGP